MSYVEKNRSAKRKKKGKPKGVNCLIDFFFFFSYILEQKCQNFNHAADIISIMRGYGDLFHIRTITVSSYLY